MLAPYYEMYKNLSKKSNENYKITSFLE